MTSFESHCERVQQAAQEAIRSASPLVRAARELDKAGQLGDVAKIRRAAERLQAAVEVADKAAAAAYAAWDLSAEDEEALLASSYEDELLGAARAGGLRMQKQDEYLVVSPSLLKVVPTSKSLQLDKAKLTALRPSHLVAYLKAQQAKKSKFSANAFIETLYAAYKLVNSNPTGVPLASVYTALTLMPDVRKEYTAMDFARDLFALDKSGVNVTRNGSRLTFPSSTGTKLGKKVYSFVSGEGEVADYYGIRFQAASDQ